MTAREYIHELLEFDLQNPELHVLELPIIVHTENGELVEGASFYMTQDITTGEKAYLHLDAPAREEEDQE